MGSGLDTIGFAFGVIGVIGTFYTVYIIILDNLPEKKLRELNEIIKDTNDLFQSVNEEGLLPEKVFVDRVSSRLETARKNADRLRSQVYQAMSFVGQCHALMLGLSRSISKLSSKVLEVRAQIASTSEKQRMKLELQGYLPCHASTRVVHPYSPELVARENGAPTDKPDNLDLPPNSIALIGFNNANSPEISRPRPIYRQDTDLHTLRLKRPNPSSLNTVQSTACRDTSQHHRRGSAASTSSSITASDSTLFFEEQFFGAFGVSDPDMDDRYLKRLDYTSESCLDPTESTADALAYGTQISCDDDKLKPSWAVDISPSPDPNNHHDSPMTMHYYSPACKEPSKRQSASDLEVICARFSRIRQEVDEVGALLDSLPGSSSESVEDTPSRGMRKSIGGFKLQHWLRPSRRPIDVKLGQV